MLSNCGHENTLFADGRIYMPGLLQLDHSGRIRLARGDRDHGGPSDRLL